MEKLSITLVQKSSTTSLNVSTESYFEKEREEQRKKQECREWWKKINMTREEGGKVKRRGCKNKEWNGKKRLLPEVLLIEIYFLFNAKKQSCAVGGLRLEGAAVQRESVLNWAAIYHSSESSDAGPHVTLLVVCMTLWVRVRVEEFCVLTLSVQTVQSHLFVSPRDKNHLWSHTGDVQLHETILGRDMNYHTEGNLNKMNSWITNISCLFCFSPFLFSLVLHESWGKWASLQPEKEKKKKAREW